MVTDANDIYSFAVGGVGQPLSRSAEFPLVKFYRKGPLCKDDCPYCSNPAMYVADLGTQERRCCQNPACMAKAAQSVWKFLCIEAEKTGFESTQEGVIQYLKDKKIKVEKALADNREGSFG
jgi:hypothetical protein